jgi:cell division FtsZ-interacting protein ZapD
MSLWFVRLKRVIGG